MNDPNRIDVEHVSCTSSCGTNENVNPATLICTPSLPIKTEFAQQKSDKNESSPDK